MVPLILQTQPSPPSLLPSCLVPQSLSQCLMKEIMQKKHGEEKRNKQTKAFLPGNYYNFLEILTNFYPTFLHGTRYSVVETAPLIPSLPML